ncbi:MAG: hypothetical protein WC702_00520 [Patescibacteria group bacterium]|jgi:hypothetical protein
MFQSDLLFLVKLIDPDMLLFFVFGLAVVLVLLLRKVPLVKPLIIVTALLEAFFVWKVAFALAVPSISVVPESFASLAFLFVWHHWIILAPVPIFLALAIIILAVYRERITEDHATVYRHLTIFSILVSFALFSLSVVESIF